MFLIIYAPLRGCLLQLPVMDTLKENASCSTFGFITKICIWTYYL